MQTLLFIGAVLLIVSVSLNIWYVLIINRSKADIIRMLELFRDTIKRKRDEAEYHEQVINKLDRIANVIEGT